MPYPKTGRLIQYRLSISGQAVANILDELSIMLKPSIVGTGRG